MKKQFLYFFLAIGVAIIYSACQPKEVSLFNGHNFDGWEGDTIKTWRIEDNAIAGGSLQDTVPENDFLCTVKPYGNFALKLQFKLTGTEGFINSGVQFRSKRLQQPPNEMEGYQADLGDGYWASIYDESRRNKTLTPIDSALIASTLKRNDWNDYEIRCEGKRIRLYLNNQLTADYTETDESIPESGLIGLQIHGGGKAKVYYKNIRITEL